MRSRLLNSVRATSFAVTIADRHAVTVRSTSLKRASMSSVSLYLSTVIPVRESVESTRRHPDRQQLGATSCHLTAHQLRINRKISANLRGVRGTQATCPRQG